MELVPSYIPAIDDKPTERTTPRRRANGETIDNRPSTGSTLRDRLRSIGDYTYADIAVTQTVSSTTDGGSLTEALMERTLDRMRGLQADAANRSVNPRLSVRATDPAQQRSADVIAEFVNEQAAGNSYRSVVTDEGVYGLHAPSIQSYNNADEAAENLLLNHIRENMTRDAVSTPSRIGFSYRHTNGEIYGIAIPAREGDPMGRIIDQAAIEFMGLVLEDNEAEPAN